ncbi:MAG: hypothetical protein JWQ98_619 [Chlorobi bacterium]|nr:hypothetical protein [Chlorobiota bacterium]
MNNKAAAPHLPRGAAGEAVSHVRRCNATINARHRNRRIGPLIEQ